MQYFLKQGTWVPVTPSNEDDVLRAPLEDQVFGDSFDEIKAMIQDRDPEARIAAPPTQDSGLLSASEVDALRERMFGSAEKSQHHSSIAHLLEGPEQVRYRFKHTSLPGAVRQATLDSDEAWMTHTFLLSKSWLGGPSLVFSGETYDMHHKTAKRSRTSIPLPFSNPIQFAADLQLHLPEGYEAVPILTGPLGHENTYIFDVPWALRQQGTPVYSYEVALIPPAAAFSKQFKRAMETVTSDKYTHICQADRYTFYYSGGGHSSTIGFDTKLWNGLRHLLGCIFRGGYGDYRSGARVSDLEYAAIALFTQLAQADFGEYHVEVVLDRDRPAVRNWDPEKEGPLQLRHLLTEENAAKLAQKLVHAVSRRTTIEGGFLQPHDEKAGIAVELVLGTRHIKARWMECLGELVETKMNMAPLGA